MDPRKSINIKKIQDIFRTKPVLLTPNIKHAFVLATDFSAFSCDFCLKQCKGDTLHPVFCGSKKLTPAERHRSCVEHEVYSMALGILRFKTYLLGASRQNKSQTQSFSHFYYKYRNTISTSNQFLALKT